MSDLGAIGDDLDPVDRIILREAAGRLSGISADQVVVIDDITGALTSRAAALAQPGRVRVHCDSLADETRTVAASRAGAVDIDVEAEPGAALLGGALAVLLRLPKSLAALDELAEAVAGFAHPDVHLFAGGRTKHMSHGMNKALSQHFSTVGASLGQQKSRVLMATGTRPSTRASYPRCRHHDDLQLTVCAHGAAFAGTSVDLGTRSLVAALQRTELTAQRVADLGCGTGVLASLVARWLPEAQVEAVDESWAACRSATATAVSNEVSDRVHVRRDHLLTSTADGSTDLVLCNPPFHRGAARDSDAAFLMFADAARVLRPDGELWTVYNSHLPYLPALRRLVGSTRIVSQDPRYVVTRSIRHP